MSGINIERSGLMAQAKKSGNDPIKVGKAFWSSTYYISWSRAQLNNTEFAPMLALLAFGIKYKRDMEKKPLSTSDKAAMIGSVMFSYLFLYAVLSEVICTDHSVLLLMEL